MTNAVDKPRIIKQDGSPVDDEPGTSSEGERVGYFEGPEAVEELAKEIHRGFRKFKNSTIVKIGIIAVAMKIVGVTGQIIIEKQRLKAAYKDRQQDDEK